MKIGSSKRRIIQEDLGIVEILSIDNVSLGIHDSAVTQPFGNSEDLIDFQQSQNLSSGNVVFTIRDKRID